MSTFASRNAAASLCVARLAGHRTGYRVLNGEAAGMGAEEQAFRYRMHELAGEVQQLRLMSGEEDRFTTGLADLWKRIYDLHEYFGKSNRIDDMIGLLMMARKEWRGIALTPGQLVVVQECLSRMAVEILTEDLMLDLGRKLEAAGVDLNSGF